MKKLKINVPEGYEIDKEKSTFENIVFKKKKELPTSYEELNSIDGFRVVGKEAISSGRLVADSHNHLYKTKEQAEASIALAKLSQLRDVYRQGWEPYWSDVYEAKFCINFNINNAVVIKRETKSDFLSFQDRETAELFLENFRDLIEQAKPLMS